jgi:hypothetical protein
MSAISEIDIRDWDQVDFKTINKVVEDGTYLDPWSYVNRFIEQVETLRDRQIEAATRHIPRVLLKERDD